jgi:hypothetical protein
VSRKTAEAERKARLEEMRRTQHQADRRRTFLVLGAAGGLAALLVGSVVWVVLGTAKDRDLGKVGLAAAAAACDPVVTSAADGTSVHVGPGTDKDTVTSVKYDSVPPTHGEHFATPEYPARAFYTVADRPKIENLVHNLEHGYTIVWYTDDLPADQKATLQKASDLARKDPNTAGKFIVSAWDDAYGAYPEGKKIGVSHWGKDHSYRQMCGGVSGAQLEKFVADHPWSDAPEPNAS